MGEQTKINADNVLKKLATGISLLEMPVRKIPTILDLGLRELQALYICNLGRSLPPSRFETFELFEQPLNKWWPSELSASEGQESLMFLGQPTPFCMDWALERGNLSTQLAEIDESVMGKFVELCRTSPASFQSNYVATRRFLIENPVISQREIVHQISLSQIHGSVQGAYEEVPSNCIHDGFFFFCDYCKDVLLWQDNQAFCRSWSVCEKQGHYTLHHRIKASPDIRRVKRGIMAYVVVPGLPELELLASIHEIGIQVTLWPGIDLYDLLVILPDQTKWGIDVKATRSARALGEREAEKGFIPNRELSEVKWDRAFYVIPDIYYDQTFFDQFCRGAKIKPRELAKRRIELVSMKMFSRILKGEIADAQN